MTESIDSSDATILDEALARAALMRDRRVDVDVVELGMVLTCRIPADGQEIERVMAAASRIEKGQVKGTNSNRAIVALLTESISIMGREMLDDDGTPLTFSSPALWKKCQAADSKGCVVALLGTDGIIANVAARLMDEGGYGDSDVDPT